MMKSVAQFTVSLVILSFFSVCCGFNGTHPFVNERSSQSEISSEMIEADLKIFFYAMSDEDSPGQGLTSISSLSGVISGCASGYRQNFSESSTKIQLYKLDRNCSAEITSFTMSGETFTPAADFNPVVGANNLFNGSHGTTGRVILLSQLSSQIYSQKQNELVDINIIQLKREAAASATTPKHIVTVRADKAEVDENDGSLSFTFLKVVQKDTSAVTINYSIGGNLTPNSDFLVPTNSFISIPASTTSQTLNLSLVNDNYSEDEKKITITPTTGTGYIFFGSASSRVTDSDQYAATTLFDFNADISGSLSTSVRSNPITSWKDEIKSTNLLTATSGNEPVLDIIGSQNAVKFGGSRQPLCGSSNNIPGRDFYTQLSLTVVFKTNSSFGGFFDPSELIFNMADNKHGHSLYLRDGIIYYIVHSKETGLSDYNWGFEAITTKRELDFSNRYVTTLVFDQGADKVTGYLNTKEFDSVNSIGKIKTAPISYGIGGLCGGGMNSNGGAFSSSSTTRFSGNIARVVLEERALSSAEVKALHESLMVEYDMPSFPAATPSSLSFTDTDNTAGEISGNVLIGKASDEKDITHYVFYWATDATTPICDDFNCGIVIAKTGSDLTHIIARDTAIVKRGSTPATHLIVFTKNESGESLTGTSVEIVDLK